MHTNIVCLHKILHFARNAILYHKSYTIQDIYIYIFIYFANIHFVAYMKLIKPHIDVSQLVIFNWGE